MSRLYIVVLLLACVTIPACQCSDKPEIGPVEGQSQVDPAAAELPVRVA